ncbi:MAG: hypothetical protein HY694_01620 [Deltaproteobacteria bacterium]|nr:hypothetical protein [Deltaproteobacteria bacterium]
MNAAALAFTVPLLAKQGQTTVRILRHPAPLAFTVPLLAKEGLGEVDYNPALPRSEAGGKDEKV